MSNILRFREGTKQFFYQYIKVVAFGIIGIGLAYSISVYFLGFLYLSNTEKIILLFTLSLLIFSITLLVPQTYFSIPGNHVKQYSRKQLILVTLSILGLSLLSLFLTIPHIPTANSLEISVLQNDFDSEGINQIDILQIDNLDMNSKSIKQISPYDLTLNGNWIIEKESLSISGVSGEESIKFINYSNNGVSLLLLRSPHAGKISINWNGKNQIIDLKNDIYDQVRIDFPHLFSWENLSFFRKSLVFILLVSNFVSIVVFFQILLSIYLFFCKKFILFSKFTFFQKLIILLIFLSPAINYFAFMNYQSVDVFKLQRIPSNTFAGLDNASKDNFPNFQVYIKLGQHYSGYQLIVPSDPLIDFRLRERHLIELGRIGSVIEKDYDPYLSVSQKTTVLKKKIDILPAGGRVPVRFNFVLEPTDQNKTICLWRFDKAVFFIPVQNDFDCQKGS